MIVNPNKKIKRNPGLGFTLVETLVAVSILTISILGTFTAVQKGLATSYFAKDQVTAFFLIQEAIEQIRNTRDTNGLQSIDSKSTGGSGVHWLKGIAELPGDPCSLGKVCRVDPYTGSLPTYCGLEGTDCPVIRQDPATGLFGYNAGWNATRFTRNISIVPVAGNLDEVVIEVTVKWVSGSFSKTITVEQSLFNNH